jgi:hypothetical protein
MGSRTVIISLDGPSEEALGVLTAGGRTEPEAIRAALTWAARRSARRSGIAAEAALLAADPHDRAVMTEVMGDLDALTDLSSG